MGLSEPVILCRTDKEFVSVCGELAAHRGIRAVVWEMSRRTLPSPLWGASSASAVLDAIAVAPTLIWCDLSAEALRRVFDVASGLRDKDFEWRVSLDAEDDLERDVTSLLDGAASPDACHAILERLGGCVDPTLRALVVAAVVLGRRRHTVRDFAKLVAASPRSIESRFAAAGVLGPEAMLGSVLVLHSLWRMEVLGQTLKSCADQAGYAGRRQSAALSELLWRHTGLRPRDLAPGAFEEKLREFVASFDEPAIGSARREARQGALRAVH